MLSRCWAPDYLVVTATNAHGVGREASVERLSQELRAKPDLLIVRHPTEVEVFTAWGMAAERGHWESGWSATEGRFGMSGRYFAKWQKYLDAGWLIQGELYVPLGLSAPGRWDRPLPSTIR